MFCTNCGNSLEQETRFCPKCGTPQRAKAPAAPQYGFPAQAMPPVTAISAPGAGAGKSGKTALWAGAAVLVLGLVGGTGYWGWTNKVAGDEVARKLAADDQALRAAADDTKRKLAEAQQQRADAERVAEAAEITAAQALLDKHIAAEEALVQTGSKMPSGGQARIHTATGTR
jgi:hypothetical protein